MPPRNPSAWARWISAMAPSRSPRIGATIRPARRSGLSLQISAAHRLYARAPASRCSGSIVATGLNPAPNGAPIVPVAASGPGNITSPVTPSLSSSSSRLVASHAPRMPISWRLLPSSSSPNHSSLNSASPMNGDMPAASRRSSMRAWRWASSTSKSSWYSGVEEVLVDGRVRARVAVGRDDDVVLHGAPPGFDAMRLNTTNRPPCRVPGVECRGNGSWVPGDDQGPPVPSERSARGATTWSAGRDVLERDMIDPMSDDELTALALAADPDTVADDDAVCLWDVSRGPGAAPGSRVVHAVADGWWRVVLTGGAAGSPASMSGSSSARSSSSPPSGCATPTGHSTSDL